MVPSPKFQVKPPSQPSGLELLASKMTTSPSIPCSGAEITAWGNCAGSVAMGGTGFTGGRVGFGVAVGGSFVGASGVAVGGSFVGALGVAVGVSFTGASGVAVGAFGVMVTDGTGVSVAGGSVGRTGTG